MAEWETKNKEEEWKCRWMNIKSDMKRRLRKKNAQCSLTLLDLHPEKFISTWPALKTRPWTPSDLNFAPSLAVPFLSVSNLFRLTQTPSNSVQSRPAPILNLPIPRCSASWHFAPRERRNAVPPSLFSPLPDLLLCITVVTWLRILRPCNVNWGRFSRQDLEE